MQVHSIYIQIQMGTHYHLQQVYLQQLCKLLALLFAVETEFEVDARKQEGALRALLDRK